MEIYKNTFITTQRRRHGVDWGGHVHPNWGGHVHPTFARDHSWDWCRSGVLGEWGRGQPTYTYSSSRAVNVSFCSALPFTCLLFTNDPIRIWSRCVRKWFLFPIHAGLLTIIRKRLQGKKCTSSIHSKHYFWLTGGFQKYQNKVANFAPRLGGPTAECFQLQGASPPDPRYRLALRARHESYSRLLSTPLFSTWRRPCYDWIISCCKSNVCHGNTLIWWLLSHLHLQQGSRSIECRPPGAYMVFWSCDPDLDPDIWNWKRYCEEVLAYQKYTFQVKAFEIYSPNSTHRHAFCPRPWSWCN